MSVRGDIERDLLDEEQVLEAVAGLIERGATLASWPEELRTALVLALTDPQMSRTESWKAVTLRRHLFGPAGDALEPLLQSRELSVLDRKHAERLRADLPALVRYRTARHLLAP